ncbi:MAG: L-lysine 6-transaminase [Pirellulales bacterium]|nr:L-lysine 6-transaminase [Pirellulales bacterium]
MAEVTPTRVRSILKKHMLLDGYPIVLDMEHSQGSRLVDRLTGRSYLDFFTFYAANPLGMNHPKLVNNPDFLGRLVAAAINKISNSDVYTVHLARFVDTFSRVGIPDHLPHAFFVAGGALAVENALKAAFDWKVRKNFKKGCQRELGTQALHLEQAFHGRSGYTMSMTNTDPVKIAYFPKFNWPRIINPKANGPLAPEELEQVEKTEKIAINQAKDFFLKRKDDIACVVLEPIQGEGGDNHFRPEFLRCLRDLAHENDALLIYDEVQTGVGLTGTFWAYEQLGVEPDILAFGKKSQVCGILAGHRIDEVEDNVFRKSSRLNSTWGGNLVDMVRFDRILEVIEEDHLVDNAADVGNYLLARIREFANEMEYVKAPRGRGLMCAFDLPSPEIRNQVIKACFDRELIILGSGTRTIRFRPALTVSKEIIDEGLGILRQALKAVMEPPLTGESMSISECQSQIRIEK